MRTVEEMLDEDGGLVMDKTTATVTVFFITVDREEAEAVAKEFEVETQESNMLGLKHFKVSWPGNLKKFQAKSCGLAEAARRMQQRWRT